MARLEWNSGLSVGVEQIDSQHKELIRIANGLVSAVEKKRTRHVVQNVVRRLRNYTVFHFNSEEKLMEAVRYPRRGEHQKEHEQLKEQVKWYQRRLYEMEEVKPENVLAFLKSWLIKHILHADFDLADHIRKRESDGNKR